MSWIPKRKIVVPIDFSDESFEALGTAVEIVDQPSHVHVVYVLPDLAAADPGALVGVVQNDVRARQVTEALRERMTAPEYEEIQIEIEFGDPGHCIAEHAKRLEADLIVMPSHGRTGLKHLLIGSVAERVLRLAHCPVLVLRK